MGILESIILGIIQGLTEFIPVSSSAHLALAEEFMGKKDLFFIVILHTGSLAAIVVVYWNDFLKLFTSRLYELLYLVVGTIPAVIIGLLFKKTLESAFDSPVAICFSLVMTGGFLYFSERYSREKITLQDAGFSRVLLIGLAQALAILPGLSRSGWTIGAALLAGIRREESVRFSFFLGAIAIAGANILKVREHLSGSQASLPPLPIILGTLITFFISLGAINFVSFLVQRVRLVWFAYYCGIVGLILLVYFSLR